MCRSAAYGVVTWMCYTELSKTKGVGTGVQAGGRRVECHMIMHVSRHERFVDECIQHTIRRHHVRADVRDVSWSRCVMLEPFNVMLGTNALNTHTMLDHIVSQMSVTFQMIFPFFCVHLFDVIPHFFRDCFHIFDFF